MGLSSVTRWRLSAWLLMSVWALVVAPVSSWAMDEVLQFNDRDNLDMSLHAGRLLPFGIVGVRSNYPMWGVRFSHPTIVSRFEYGVNLVQSQGVTLYQGTVSARVDFNLASATEGFFCFGGSLTHYQRKGTVARPNYPYATTGGGHFGFGAYYDVSRSWALRADFISHFGPGRTLYTGLGLIYRWGSQGGS